MSSGKKILTVSYGNFSCTLEGFDDAFSAMKAITEYFRSLSEGGLQLNSETAQPSIETLKTIAENELKCGVDISMDERGLVLKPNGRGATESSQPTLRAVAPKGGAMVLGGDEAPQVTASGDPVKRLDGLRRTAAGTKISAKFAAKSAEVLANSAEKTRQSESGGSVADKLSRIRSAAVQTKNAELGRAQADGGFSEDEAEVAPLTSVDKPDHDPQKTTEASSALLLTPKDALVLTPSDKVETAENQAVEDASEQTETPQDTEFSDGAEETSKPTKKKSRKTRKGQKLLGRAGKASVTRLVETANSQLEGPENLRRLSAIAHLKAAVAATAADREHGGDEDGEEKALDRYRSDLTQIVHAAEDAEAPSAKDPAPKQTTPLMLVSTQRIGQPDHSAPNVPEDGPAPSKASVSFPEFATLSDADDLISLLEVAAAYLAIHEGREEFSRQLVMQTLSEVVSEEEVSREDGVRAFGTLLKQGKIAKGRRGLFSLPKNSRYAQS